MVRSPWPRASTGATGVSPSGGEQGDGRRVGPEPAVEEKAPRVGGAEPDPTEAAASERLPELLCRLHRVVRDADAAGEHVGGPAGERREGRGGTGQPVGGLVECAVTGE